MTATKTTPESEFLGRWWLPWYNPRKHPMPIPDERWDEGECWCLSVNRRWGSHILGVLDLLDQWDTWIGTDEEIEAARIQVNEIKECFTRGNDMGCGCGGAPVPTNVTFDENGNMLVSYDGGITWEPAPDGFDPRYSGSVAPPIPGADGDEKRCNAASSAMEVIRDQQEQLADDAGMWAGINGAVGALITLLIFLGIVGSGGLLTPLLLGLAAALLTAGQAAFIAAFNDDVYKIVQCAIYCYTDESASPYTADDIANIRAKIAIDLEPGIAQVFIDKTLEVWGATGLTNASRAGFISAVDCTDCDCGSCDLSAWTADAGTILQQTSTYIELEAEEVSPNDWSVQIRAPSDNDCCCGMTYEILTGGVTITVVGYVPCGLPVNSGNISFSYAGGSLRWYDIATHDGTFTVRITASEC